MPRRICSRCFAGPRLSLANLGLCVFVFAARGQIAAAEPPPAVVRLTTDGHFKQRPAWSPNGEWLSFTRHIGASYYLYVRSAKNDQERRLTSQSNPESDAAWSPDGLKLAFCYDKTVPNQGDMDVYLVGVQGENLQPVVTNSGKLSHEEWPSWSPDGQWLALHSTRDGNPEIYVVRPTGKDLRRLTSDPAIDAHAAWSPDGKEIAFATSRFGDLEIAVIDIEGGNLRRLTTSRGLDDYPTWSPDGQRLAFTSNRDGNLEVYTCDRAGGALRNETRHNAIDNFPAWAPAGHLTLVSNRDDGFDLYTLAPGAQTSATSTRDDRAPTSDQ